MLITARQLADILATVFTDWGDIDPSLFRAVADTFQGDNGILMEHQSEMYEALSKAAAEINEMAQ